MSKQKPFINIITLIDRLFDKKVSERPPCLSFNTIKSIFLTSLVYDHLGVIALIHRCLHHY